MNTTRRLNSFVTLLVTGLLFIAGCTKQGGPSASMNATINDTAFAAIGPHVLSSGAKGKLTTVQATNLAVQGNLVATTIVINVLNTPATYNFSPTDYNSNVKIILSSGATAGLPVFATSGQVKVTSSSDHLIQGTFNFNYTDALGKSIPGTGMFTGTF